MKVSVIQHNPQDDLQTSLDTLYGHVRQAAEAGADLISLPEYYAYMGDGADLLGASGSWFDDINGKTGELAKELGVAIHAGSIAEKREDGVYNTTVVHSPDGNELARYSKIHLFDIDLPNGESYRESDFICGGKDVATYDYKGWTIGCSICYDIRFPVLYRKLRDMGAELIMVPAAFTRETGRAHWEVLLRARAIETACYVAAPAQIFSHDNGNYHCYGHSLICDPWGNIIANASDKLGFVDAYLDKEYLAEVRQRIPVHRHHILA